MLVYFCTCKYLIAFVAYTQMWIILKTSSLRLQPRLLLWTKKAGAEMNGGFYPLGFTQATWDKTQVEIAGRAKWQPNRLGSLKRPTDTYLTKQTNLCNSNQSTTPQLMRGPDSKTNI